MVAVAAFIFSLAHISGWDIVKLPQVFIMGLILGYLFMEFGIYACILAHSILDVSSAVAFVAGDAGAICVELAFIGIGVIVLAFLL